MQKEAHPVVSIEPMFPDETAIVMERHKLSKRLADAITKKVKGVETLIEAENIIALEKDPKKLEETRRINENLSKAFKRLIMEEQRAKDLLKDIKETRI